MTIQFTEAPIDNDEEAMFDPDMTNETMISSTANDGLSRTPGQGGFQFDSSLVQATSVTPGTQLSGQDLNEGALSQEEDEGGHGTSGSNEAIDFNDPIPGPKEVFKGPFLKTCVGMSANVNQETAACIAFKAFEAVFDKDMAPEMRIQVLGE